MSFLHVSNGADTSEMSPVAARHLAAPLDSTQRIIRVLLALSLSIGSISVLATLSALYWFVKMRRSFRHE
jgi:hypothetical protein